MPSAPMDPGLRDALVREFRRRTYDQTGFVPITHQAEWQCATEGWTVTDTILSSSRTMAVPDPHPELPSIVTSATHPRSPLVTVYERHLLVPRQFGPAHHASDLGSFKIGKSYGLAAWMAGFACLPQCNGVIGGLEYKTSEHEFNYLVDFLCSRSGGLGLKHKKLQNDPRGGRMQLELKNGASFEAKSWERKESFKGDEVDFYVWAEAYQLPGIETFTSTSQNLRARKGFSVWGTTCDRPWVKLLHQMGHGNDPDWHCSCGVPGWVNPHTFDFAALCRDCPDPALFTPYLKAYPWLAKVTPDRCRGLMTKERFEIAWLGRLGSFFGSVYAFQQGDRVFTPASHPYLYTKAYLEKAVTELLEGVQ